MKTKLNIILVGILAGILIPASICAQQKDWGKVSGSLESNSAFYFNKDKSTEIKDSFGTNTFVNLGYEISKFQFGLQYDIFEPPMAGYSSELKGNKIMQGFAAYSSSRFDARLGSFYEQFGSGLLFRSYEDRNLAFNNSLLGAAVAWRPADWVSLKAIAGKPRKFMKYAKSMVYGTDAEFMLGDKLFKENNIALNIGGSWLLRDDNTDLNFKVKDAPQTIRGYSGRLEFSKGIFSIGGEYVAKSKAMVHNKDVLNYVAHKGDALLLKTGIDYQGFGLSIEHRTIRYMGFFIDDITGAEQEAVALNYIPSLTQQHKYSIMSLYPYVVENSAESGGHADIFGSIPAGDNPIDFTINGAYYYALKAKQELDIFDPDLVPDYYFMKYGKFSYAEVGMELKRKWNKQLKTTIASAWQKKHEFSNTFGDMLINTESVVADVLYKFNRKTSLRVELSHAWSDSKDDQAWAGGLAEVGLAPKWMFFVSDMFNYKTAGDVTHYYSVGGSFTWKMIRGSLSYGKTRAGMQCSGGVCRYEPEHEGITIGLSVIL